MQGISDLRLLIDMVEKEQKGACKACKNANDDAAKDLEAIGEFVDITFRVLVSMMNERGWKYCEI